MRHRFLLVVVVTALSLTPAHVSGQTPAKAGTMPPKTAVRKTWSPPLTPYGKPDLQGVWVSKSATPLERPKELEGKQFLTQAEVAELKKRAERIFKDGNSDFASGDNAFLAAWANVEQYKNPNISVGSSLEMVDREFDNRTSLILDPPDGKIPPLTPEGRQRAASWESRQHLAAGPEDLSNPLRCISYGVPRIGGNFGAGPYSYYQIFQTPEYVVVEMEMIHEARIIPLDGRPHLPPKIRQWDGDSRGHWEGQTLVVDTTNFYSQSYFMGSAENLHMIEKFRRVGPDTLEYEITLEDPTTWTRPWTAMLRFKRTDEKMYECACHEGNEQVMVGMLAGARAEEKAAAK